MSNRLFGTIIAGALAAALALASPALARGGGGGGGGGHGGMGGGGHGMGGMGGGGGWGGGMHGMGAMAMHPMGGGIRTATVGPHWSGGMGPRWAGTGWHRAQFAHFPFHNRFHHRFNRFAFFAGAPYYDYAYYDGCWRRVWTSYGPRLVNVCGDYGY